MKPRHTLAVLMLMGCLSIIGQPSKTVSMQGQAKSTSTQVVNDQQETILKLQAENEAMQKQLEKMEKEIELYRGDVRAKEAAINENQGHWLTILSIVVSVIVLILGIGLGVIAPIILNRISSKRLEERFSEMKADLGNQVKVATEQANNVKKAFNDILPQIESVKKQVVIVTEQARRAEEAAKEAKARYLLTYAENENDVSIALDLYTQIINLSPYIPEAFYHRAILRSINNLEGALEDLNKAIELTPDYIDALLDRGNVKIGLNDNFGAVLDLNKVIELRPNDMNAYSYRGVAKEKLRDYDGAMMDFNKAIEIVPGYYQYLNRGKLKYIINDIIGALNDLDKSTELCPTYIESLDNRAKCYRKLAETEQNAEKKAELISKAEADEQKAEALKKGNSKA